MRPRSRGIGESPEVEVEEVATAGKFE